LAYAVAILESALKQLQKLPAGDQRRIRERIDQLADTPRPAAAKKLAGGSEELWRIRSGDYRIIYTIVDRELVVTVVRVGNRQDVYRNLEALIKPKPQPTPKPKKKRR
jgi:mRNA interferase RelE/StbE